jgi:hypothetical protein
MAYKKNKENNKDYVDKVVPNSECGKLLIVQYNPADKDHKSWLSVAAECAKNDQKRALQLISVARGDTADQIYALLTGKTAK